MFKTSISRDEHSQVTLSNNEHSDKSSMMISSLDIVLCFSMEVPAECFTFTFSCFFLLCLVTFELFTAKLLSQTSALFNVSNVDVTFAKNLQSKKKRIKNTEETLFIPFCKSHMLTFHFTSIFILLPVYKNQCTCIYILITKLTCQFVENFPASFYSQFEQVFQCTEIKYTQILKNGQFGFRKFMQ